MKGKLTLIEKLTIYLSIAAIVISLLSTYFQFFYKRHKILYTTLEPTYNEIEQTITIPILFKNLGNQTEIILNPHILIQRKELDGSSLSTLLLNNKKNFPLLLSPGESKLIELIGCYKNYLLGSYEISEQNEFIFHPINILDSLKLVVDMEYITTVGLVGNQEIEVGYLSFDDKKKLERIDCNQIKIRRLPIRWPESESQYFTVRTRKIDIKLDPTDPNFSDKFRLIKELKNDSIFGEFTDPDY